MADTQHAPPTPTQDPGGEHATPLRPLKTVELTRLHRELDYVTRFTNRYAILFDIHFFRGNPQLVQMCEAVCNDLVAMQAAGPTTQAHCTKLQLQFLTVEQVHEYITAVIEFSDKSLRSYMHLIAHAANFPHWEHDHAVLVVMRDNAAALLNEISPDGATDPTPAQP